MIIAIASVFLILSQLFKALRLYFVLGYYRVKLLILFVLCSSGVVCSYFTGGKPVIYELLVAIPLCLFLKIPFFASIYSLIVLRIFDAALLLLFIPVVEGEFTKNLIIIMLLLVATSWLLISTLPIIIRRLEKRILISRVYSPVFAYSIKHLVSLNKSFSLLAFGRKGSIPLTILLTAFIWFFEIIALGIVTGSYIQGSQSVINRVAGSLGIFNFVKVDYKELILVLCAVTVIFGFGLIIRKIIKK